MCTLWGVRCKKKRVTNTIATRRAAAKAAELNCQKSSCKVMQVWLSYKNKSQLSSQTCITSRGKEHEGVLSPFCEYGQYGVLCSYASYTVGVLTFICKLIRFLSAKALLSSRTCQGIPKTLSSTTGTELEVDVATSSERGTLFFYANFLTFFGAGIQLHGNFQYGKLQKRIF